MNKNTALIILGVAAFFAYQNGTFTKVQADITANSYTNLTATDYIAVAGLAIGVWELV